MKNLILILFCLVSLSGKSQQINKINYWTWSEFHLKQEPQKWNRYDYSLYMPRYYVAPTISFSLKLKYMKPSNYFFYREKKRVYKFIF